MSQVNGPEGSADRSHGGNWASWIALVAILLLAMATRVHDLDGQSIWNDEGLSIYRAEQSMPTILANTITLDGLDSRDTNPALYFLLLHLWRSGTGESIFAYRYLSVLAGVLSVALLYQVGRRSFNRWVGVGAAFLLALSPFHVWMSQEIRNYTLLLLFNLLSIYGLFRYASGPAKPGSWLWLALWGAAGVAGIYTHFFGAFVFAYGILALVWLWLKALRRERRWRPSRGLLIALIVVGLISIPILWTGFSRFRVEKQIDFVFVPLQHLTSHALSAYSVGLIQTFVQPLWRVVPAVLLAITGAVAGWLANRRSERQDLVPLILGYLVLPFLFLFVLSAITPIYNGPRHLLMGLPPFLLLVAAGAVLPWTMAAEDGAADEATDKPAFWRRPGAWRAIAAVLAAWLVIGQAQWLHTQFTSDELVKEDFRGLALYLGQVAQEEDLIVLHDTISGPIFDYYYDGAAEWRAIPAFWQNDRQAALAELQAAGDQAQRIWFVTEPEPRTGFPRQLLSQWAKENWQAFSSESFPWLWLRLKLNGYAPEPLMEQLPPGATASDVQWGDALQLHGFEAAETGQAGAYWQPALYWSRDEVAPEGYRLSFRLLDEQGQVWAHIDQPLWAQYPPDQWPEGKLVRHQPIVALPAGLPPGEYQVRLRVNRISDDQPLLANGEIEMELPSSLMIEAATYPKDQQALPAHTPVKAMLGGQIEVASFSIAEGEYKPGHVVPIDVLWQVHRSPEADYILLTQLLDDQGEVVSESRGAPSRSNYPATSWQTGEYLSGQAQLLVPANAEAGHYSVQLSLLDPDSLEPLRAGWLPGRDAVDLGELRVTPWPLESELPSISVPYRADFGQPPLIELHGYALTHSDGRTIDQVSPGDNLALTLLWRSLSDSLANYSVFVHLMDDSDDFAAQGDGFPVNGFRPTTSWREGEVIIDTHQLAIPAGVEAGEYALWVGFYDPDTVARLPVTAGGEMQADNRLLLDRIQVLP